MGDLAELVQLDGICEYNYYDFGSNGPSVAVGLAFLDPRNAISTQRSSRSRLSRSASITKLFNP